MLKYGNICEVDYSKGRARVHFDEINIVSGWLPLPSFSTKSTKQFIPLEINTQVTVLMHSDGEQGEIVKAVWSSKDTPPGWANENTHGIQFKDGTTIIYNSQSHELNITLCDGGKLKVNAKNQALEAILGAINGAPVMEPGNVSPSAFQASLKDAISGKDQFIWEV